MVTANRYPRAASLTTAVVGLLLALGLTGCGQGSDQQTGGSVTPEPDTTSTSPDTPVTGTPGRSGTPSGTPSAPAGPADLTIVVDDGAGGTTSWHLVCDPAGGTHPDPALACGVLGARGEQALPPVAQNMMCTEIYGGAQTARISGTWHGQAVDAHLSRTNGCEIARWDALVGLLPHGGA